MAGALTDLASEQPLGDATSAAVIGLGAVSAFGWSADELAVGLRAGATSVGEPTCFSTEGHRTRLVSEVFTKGRPSNLKGPDTWGSLARADQFAVAAAREAFDQAFPSQFLRDELSPKTIGVFFGGSTAGMAEAETYFSAALGVSAERPRLRHLRSQQLNGPGDAVARELGVNGPVVSFSSACASGALAIGAALAALRSQEVEIAVAGGSDSLCQMTYAGFNALRAVDPELSRPFRASRAGLNLGEGSGALVLVAEPMARQLESKGVRVLAWLRGAGASCDAHHMTAPHPQGEGAVGAMRAALENGGVGPGEVAFVNAHGTGTPHNDSAEAAAIRTLVEKPLPVTSVKGAIGHLLGAAGAIEAVATVMALVEGAVQPTTDAGVDEAADPDFGIDLVLKEVRALSGPEAATALSNSFAFGGANAALVFSTRSSSRRSPDDE